MLSESGGGSENQTDESDGFSSDDDMTEPAVNDDVAGPIHGTGASIG